MLLEPGGEGPVKYHQLLPSESIQSKCSSMELFSPFMGLECDFLGILSM